LQSWALYSAGPNEAKSISWSSNPVYSGSRSVEVYVEFINGGAVTIEVPFCSTNLSGNTFTAHVRFESSSGALFPGGYVMTVAPGGTSSASIAVGDSTPNALGMWHTWTATLPSGDPSTYLSIYIPQMDTTYSWYGTIYFDEVYIR
jgi:hypothetical protein